MDYLLKPFDEILTTRLRPWLSRNILSEGKYRELNEDFKQEFYTFQPKWQVAFLKPITPIRTYYKNIISNASINFLNTIVKNVSTTKIENERLYWISAGVKSLLQKFKEVNQIIESKAYHWQAFQGRAIGSDATKSLRDEAYIIQLLKYHLIHSYQELAETYSSLFKADQIFTVKELHRAFFQEPGQENIIEKAESNNQLPAKTKAISKQPIEFIPKPYDFNGDADSIIPYNSIVSNPDNLSTVEDELFKLGLLKPDSTFNKRRGNADKFAAVIAIIYSKGFFKSRYIIEGVSNKKIDLADIRSFIEHRYKCKIDQQLRKFANHQLKLKLFVNKHPFLNDF